MLLINLALQAMLVNFPPQPPAGLFLLISKPTLDSQNVGLSVNHLEDQRIPEHLEDGACRHQHQVLAIVKAHWLGLMRNWERAKSFTETPDGQTRKMGKPTSLFGI
jgi:hypothetical protein